MNDDEKYQLAKKNYEEFLEKLKTVNFQTKNTGLISSYVVDIKGNTIEDFYWTDHDMTPTGLYKWIKLYKKPIVKVILPKTLYDELKTMIKFEEPLEMDGVLVTYR